MQINGGQMVQKNAVPKKWCPVTNSRALSRISTSKKIKLVASAGTSPIKYVITTRKRVIIVHNRFPNRSLRTNISKHNMITNSVTIASIAKSVAMLALCFSGSSISIFFCFLFMICLLLSSKIFPDKEVDDDRNQNQD